MKDNLFLKQYNFDLSKKRLYQTQTQGCAFVLNFSLAMDVKHQQITNTINIQYLQFFIKEKFLLQLYLFIFLSKNQKKDNLLTMNLTCILIINNGSQNLFRRLN